MYIRNGMAQLCTATLYPARKPRLLGRTRLVIGEPRPHVYNPRNTEIDHPSTFHIMCNLPYVADNLLKLYLTRPPVRHSFFLYSSWYF